jgi:hypothetical protein
VRSPARAALVALAGLAACAPWAFRLEIQDSWVANFDPASDLVTAERDYNAHFWG